MMIYKEDDFLRGFSIGLSGAIPKRDEWSEPALDRAILEFVSNFTALVFKYGGHIIHGCHPSFTPVIVRQAERTSLQGKPLTLLISELWVDSVDDKIAKNYLRNAEIIVVRRAGIGGHTNADTRNKSLSLLRRHLLQRMNILVAVGGQLHEHDVIKPGVLEEVKYAYEREMPYFIIGGLGGMAGKLPTKLIEGRRNTLSNEDNKYLMESKDISSSVRLILNHLIKHQERFSIAN